MLIQDHTLPLPFELCVVPQLKTGQLIIVPSALVPRQKKHLCSLPEAGRPFLTAAPWCIPFCTVHNLTL